MKSQKLVYVMILTILFSVAAPMLTLATTIDAIKSAEVAVEKESASLSLEIESVVDTINEKYQELAKIDEKIAKAEDDITVTEKDIEGTQKSIEKRTAGVADRMKAIQLQGSGNNSLEILLGAESIGDLVNLAYAVTVLQNAEKTKIDSLHEAKDKLDQLEAKLINTQADLQTQQKNATKEKSKLDLEVVTLKTKLANNAAELNKLTTQRITQENKQREQAAAALKAKELEDAKLAQVETNTSGGSGAQSGGHQSGSGQSINKPVLPPTPPPNPTTPTAPNSGSFPGQATAYLATGNKTATGTVPAVGRTIAVDRNLIPLGSRVQIEVPSAPQYSGVYTAEDTGGAVQGAIVDIFVGGRDEAREFGRRAIVITVL